MRYDFSPLFRSTVGFDRLFNMIGDLENEQTQSYPPYNIEKLSDDAYRITIAVAGFKIEDLEIEAQENQLLVLGRVGEERNDASSVETTVVYRGIAERAFERRFSLADHVKVTGADLADGLLHIELEREIPESLKPRQIPIGTGVHDQKKIKTKAA